MTNSEQNSFSTSLASLMKSHVTNLETFRDGGVICARIHFTEKEVTIYFETEFEIFFRTNIDRQQELIGGIFAAIGQSDCLNYRVTVRDEISSRNTPTTVAMADRSRVVISSDEGDKTIMILTAPITTTKSTAKRRCVTCGHRVHVSGQCFTPIGEEKIGTSRRSKICNCGTHTP